MFADPSRSPRLSEVSKEFLDYTRVVLTFSPESTLKYRDCLQQIQRILGDLAVAQVGKAELFALRADLVQRHLSASRQASILITLKRLLLYCREERSLSTLLDPDQIEPPRQPRREVAFLSAAEVERLISSISLETRRGQPRLANIRLRALVEVLLGTAMRIGEALNLDRNQVDFETGEATIIGKGNKQRVAFFTDRALSWLRFYMQNRSDEHPAVFICLDGARRLKRTDVWRSFRRLQSMSGMSKRITPHILRHTAATQLLFNGCPISHIKEILGHERLETTCRYYLGLDRRAAKSAHRKYLIFNSENESSAPK